VTGSGVCRHSRLWDSRDLPDFVSASLVERCLEGNEAELSCIFIR
jgi:hypothetical protein